MKVVVNEFMSLDGVVQAPGGPEEDVDGGFAHGGWSMPYFEPDAMGGAIDTTLQSAEALLFGRRTWQAMAGAWPERAGDPFADQMNAIQKYVASRTLTTNDLAWNNSQLLSADDAIGDIAELRARDGGDLLVMGSPTLVRSLLGAGLIDELNLMIEPILLGGGKGIFPDEWVARPLQLVSSTSSSTGVLICTYRPT